MIRTSIEDNEIEQKVGKFSHDTMDKKQQYIDKKEFSEWKNDINLEYDKKFGYKKERVQPMDEEGAVGFAGRACVFWHNSKPKLGKDADISAIDIQKTGYCLHQIRSLADRLRKQGIQMSTDIWI
jgi:hypothetical protein